MSKKDKKNKKLFGMDPMIIGVLVVLSLLCVYLGVVLILGEPWNIFEWLSGSSTTSEVANTTSAPSSGQSAASYVPPPPPPPDTPLTIDQIGINAANVPVQGGKLLRKLRRR